MKKQSETDLKILQLAKEVETLKQANERLNSIAFRKTAQVARDKLKNGKEESQARKLRKRISAMRRADFMETAISIISWEGLPELDDYGFFHSKRIEKSIATYPVCLFPDKYAGQKTYYVVPFVGASESFNPYSEFAIVRPYNPSGKFGKPVEKDFIFGKKIINKDCVILTDFFEFEQTSGNTSYTLQEAINLYADMIADCEVTKKVNRNFLKIPFLFGKDSTINSDDLESFAMQMRIFMDGIDANEPAIFSEIANNLKIIDTKNNYYGRELTEEITEYTNQLYEYLGISHNVNEKKAQQNVEEITKGTDQYSIRIKRRLQNRQIALDNMKRLWPEDFANTELKVNLSDYNNNFLKTDIGGNDNGDTINNP